MTLTPQDKAEVHAMIQEETEQFVDVDREITRLKRVVKILLERNGGLSEAEVISIEAEGVP